MFVCTLLYRNRSKTFLSHARRNDCAWWSFFPAQTALRQHIFWPPACLWPSLTDAEKFWNASRPANSKRRNRAWPSTNFLRAKEFAAQTDRFHTPRLPPVGTPTNPQQPPKRKSSVTGRCLRRWGDQFGGFLSFTSSDALDWNRLLRTVCDGTIATCVSYQRRLDDV